MASLRKPKHTGDGPGLEEPCAAEEATHEPCDAGEVYVIFGSPG